MKDRNYRAHLRNQECEHKAPFQEENLYGKETSYEETTAEKEILGPWIGTSLEMSTTGGCCGCGGTRRGVGEGQGIREQFHFHLLGSQNTLLDFSRA